MTTQPERAPGRQPTPSLRLVSAPPPLPRVEGGFKTVLADPPWRFTNRTGKVAPEHRRLDRYSTLPPARSQVNMIETRKREHSRKPDEQYDLIEACSPGPYLEMFARYPQEGWTVWGDEAETEVQPRGQTHKGYGGGEVVALPRLDPHERIPHNFAVRLGAFLRQEYEAGKSIRELATATDYSIQRIRSLLELADTPLRRRGAASTGT